jgi:thiamine-monophosphate kinase
MRRHPRSTDGENRVVQLLCSRFGGRSAQIEMGIGDDAAVFRPAGAKEKWLVTTDMLLEDVDFRRDWQTPEQLGWRALAVNLSDLAAMGARPRFYTVALGVPAGTGEKWIGAFYRGMAKVGALHKTVLVGGDLSRSPSGIHITIAAIGESRDRKVVYRSSGRSGDILYVTGALGLAAAGLRLLELGRRRPGSGAERKALDRQRTPMPRCASGFWLAQSGFAGSMIDLSDGLSMDLPRLCRASGAGAEIRTSQLPVFSGSTAWGCDPTSLALHGGEDFELLFSVRAGKARRFEEAYPRRLPPACRIGRLISKPGVYFISEPGNGPRPLAELGFDHFRDARS